MSRMRRSLSIARMTTLVACCLLMSAGIAGPAHGAPQALKLNQRLFWDGANVTDSGPDDTVEASALAETGAAACLDPRVKCFDYSLETEAAPAGSQLRVAIDHPSVGDPPPTASTEIFSVVVTGPTQSDGSRQSATHSGMVLPVPPGNAQYSSEVRITDPDPGLWQITVVATRVRNPEYAERPAFRVRAGLRPAPRPPDSLGDGQYLLPNLRPAPPFELVFATCDDGSSWPESRCLRYAFGPGNIGKGPLDLLIEPPPSEVNPEGDPQGENIVKAPEYQVIHSSDGTKRKQWIAEAGFHTSPGHLHYHHPATAGAILFRVDPDTKELAPAAPPEKTGFCLGDYWIADWQGFDQQADADYATQTMQSTCAAPNPAAERFGLSTGWGDVYSAGTPGNQMHFPVEDGLYVLVVTTNACPTALWMADETCHGTIIESEYDDNSAFAYFEARDVNTVNPKIMPLERALGTGPFDDEKAPADDIRSFLHPPIDAVPFLIHE